MSTSIFDFGKAQFLTASSLAYELQILSEIGRNGFVMPARSSFRSLADTVVQGYMLELTEQKLIEKNREGGDEILRLTAAGQDRLRYLLVDYIQELLSLHGKAREFVRTRLAEYYLKGIRNVALYPVGETAEVIYDAMHDSGLKLVGAIDDDPMRWDADFHGIPISGPSTLPEIAPDAVIVSTSVFVDQISDRLRSMNLPKVQIVTI
jgi:hypothetical protein